MVPHFAKPLSPLNRHKILRRIFMAKATKEERRNKVIEVLNKAPHFDLIDQNGQNVGLSDFTGKKLFLYFYPKANTSG
jgi:peroxiredoxin